MLVMEVGAKVSNVVIVEETMSSPSALSLVMRRALLTIVRHAWSGKKTTNIANAAMVITMVVAKVVGQTMAIITHSTKRYAGKKRIFK